MPRGRLMLQYLKNVSARRVTYKKRKKGVLKKVEELSTLCDVDTCAVIMSDFEATPTVWPSLEGLQRVVSRFNNMPEFEKTKHQSTLNEFNEKRLYKLKMKLNKQLRENKELEINLKINECLKGESSLQNYPQDIDAIELAIQRQMEDLENKIKSRMAENPEMMRAYNMQVGESSNNDMGFPLEAQQPSLGWNDNHLSLYDLLQSFPTNMGDNHGA